MQVSIRKQMLPNAVSDLGAARGSGGGRSHRATERGALTHAPQYKRYKRRWRGRQVIRCGYTDRRHFFGRIPNDEFPSFTLDHFMKNVLFHSLFVVTTAVSVASGSAHAELAFNALTANALTANALTANALTANALTANALTANALTANALTANALTANALTANALTANALTANALTANALTNNGLGALPSLQDLADKPLAK